ncbi:MAG TPA: 2-isopropylmalate synthase [Parvularculaceae bacterium]|nr:2-isopropylmalate synthase [Amphiplicatus sp.]MCB9955494.1 2-isopropylmalate synthase [Caulobacterales bacterium]HPE30129.1 2-isopropylmalate synthase [Parvularculaceae bacterium]HRX39304.1 2-isopropylmalate synthase [Parvularculaceae bacterium]
MTSNTVPDVHHVKIFDTTLRDGEQAPGFSMAVDAKMVVARALRDLNVDIIEAGFAAASPGDSAAVRTVASEIEGPTICSLARLTDGDIDAALEALQPAKKKRVHVFIGTSPLHREAKLKLTKDQIIERIGRLVRYARSGCEDIEFSPEDAIRTERDYLVEACAAAVEAGATTLNIPDTVGYTTPEEIYDLFSFLVSNVPGADKVTFSTHCHDDLGMAVANSLAAVRGGARQIECALNGIGERAGNCSLEEAVMALATRKDYFGVSTQIETTKIYPAAQALSRVTHNPIPRNKAIVGKNAFAHESGIHQHGVLANKRTYEIMDAEAVGMPSNSIVLGKHSGKHALSARIEALGFDVGQNRLNEIFAEFKALADATREVTDADLIKLVTGASEDGRAGPWRVRRTELAADFEDDTQPWARITMEHENGERRTVTEQGGGPIDAAFAAVCAIADVKGRIVSLDLHHLADADEGLVRAEAVIEAGDRRFTGVAREVDVADAAVAAFVVAVNQAAAFEAATAAA